MADRLPIVGPYRMIATSDGQQVPFYIVSFDDKIICQDPQTRGELVEKAQDATYTDIFLFSHGWNNDWTVAHNSYDSFIDNYIKMQQTHALPSSRPMHPLMVGIFWPSIVLVSPDELNPGFAGDGDPQVLFTQVAQERQQVQSLADLIPPESRERFYTLTQQVQGLSQDDALELAGMLASLYSGGGGNELPTGNAPTPEDIVNTWRKVAQNLGATENTTGTFKFAHNTGGGPVAAGGLDFLDPRWIVRLATVLQMKDRAGDVGAKGVGPLLIDLLTKNPTARVHLIGHSYGCKVLLSALCYQELPRPVHSLLLLQAAISYLCFAQDATGNGQPGGYRIALQRVKGTIMTTFSSEDMPLSQLFQWAVTRPSDIGEMNIGGEAPSRYAALGGYGPGGCDADCKVIPIKSIGDAYDMGADAPKIYALNGANAIHGHTDIDNQYTWWALYEQVIN